jgi:hypothetical protein
VRPCEGTLWDIQPGADVYQGHIRTQQPQPLDGVLVPAPRVNATEDPYVTGGNCGATLKVLAADVHEVGVSGEWRGKGIPVQSIPGGLQLANDVLECVAFCWW